MATNDQADLRGKLEVQIGETHPATGEVWTTVELNLLVDQGVDALWPRFSRPLEPSTTTITVIDAQTQYTLPAGVRAVSRIDVFDSGGLMLQSLPGRSWELTGDVLSGSGGLFISYTFAVGGYTLHLVGYGVYDTATNLIPNRYAPLVLARARAEAYRRVAADRVKFQEWRARNQTQNVSVNELIQFINEADAEANRLVIATPKVFQKPVSGFSG